MPYRFRDPTGQDLYRDSEGNGVTEGDPVRNKDVVEINLGGQRVAANRPFPVADANMGTDGANAPAIAGTGVRGWLRALYEAFIARIPASISGRLPVQAEGTVNVGNLPATQNVTGSVTANLGSLNGAATNATVQAAVDSLGSDGASPPAIAGTGVRGWLRAIYEALLARLPLTGGKLDTRPLASGTDSVTVAGTVTANVGATGALATTANVQAVTDSLGEDGGSPPAIAGTGVRGWLRAIYETLLAPLRATGYPDQGVQPVVVDTTAYAAGQQLGGFITFPGMYRAVGRGLILQRVSYLSPLDNLNLRVVFFRQAPGTTVANHGTFSIASGDRSFFAVDVALVKTRAYSGSVVYTADLGATPVRNTLSQDLCAAIIVESGTPTFSSSAGGTLIAQFTQE